MCATLAGPREVATLSTVRRLTGKRALLEQLIADGVSYIFGNPGTTEQGFMDILQDYPQVQFMLKPLLICGLEQSRPQLTMHFDCGRDDRFSKLF